MNYTDFENALKNLNIIKFEDIVTSNKAKAMFKIAHHESPTYLCDMFKMKEQENTNSTMTLGSVTYKNIMILQSLH